MPFTTSIKRRTGTPGGATDTTVTSTTSRFSTSDVAAPGTNNPLPIPDTGLVRSFKQTLFLNADNSPTGTVNNVRVYTDGAGWTGATVKVKSVTTYTQATGTVGQFGDAITGTTDLFSYTAGSPLTVPGTLSNPATGRISDYVELQVEMQSTFVAGQAAAETMFWAYDAT